MELKCKDCGWQGLESNLKIKNYYLIDGDISKEPVCPECGSAWLESVVEPTEITSAGELY